MDVFGAIAAVARALEAWANVLVTPKGQELLALFIKDSMALRAFMAKLEGDIKQSWAAITALK